MNEHRNPKELMGIPEIRDEDFGCTGCDRWLCQYLLRFASIQYKARKYPSKHTGGFSYVIVRRRRFSGSSKKFSPGIDEIDGRAVRAVAAEVSEPLAYLINKSFRVGIFPDALKESKCIPIYKN
ncbi:hypothetical protein HHI36_004933 [Cryptolaemus montrouzieri]|uniref:Uncharacterized protein n=1 Tax=Cryptolaemus montrouzieri TaxID=559131 RepID=A0ABD2NSX9_9CUCU